MTFDIELFHTHGSFLATMRGDGCGFTSVRWDSAAAGVQIDLTSLYIDRRTSTFGADENCIGCM